MSNFKSNNREKKSYDQLEKTILKNGFNTSIFNNDINLYLSKLYNKLAERMRNNHIRITEARIQNEDYSEILSENLRILYEELLSKTAMLESLRYSHNQQFSIIGNRVKKPLILEEKDVAKMFLETNENSLLELLAKNMDWYSKTSKEVEVVCKNILEKIPGDLEINWYTMRYIYDYISSVCIDGKIIKEHLLNYNGNLENSEEIEKDIILKRLKRMLDITNREFKTEITLTDIYKFASCKRLEEYLYKGKAFAQIELYRQETQKRKKGENTGIIIDIERDKNMSGTNFNTRYNVYMPFYTNNFRDHSDVSEFSYIMHKQVLDGDDPTKFPLDFLEEIPFRPYITFKLTPQRIFDIYGILEEYDNPKVNCFISDDNRERLNKVYGYFSEILHYSINGKSENLTRLLEEGNIGEFKKQVKKDKEAFSKKIENADIQRVFE